MAANSQICSGVAWDVLSNANHWLGLCREIHICSRPSYKVRGHAEANQMPEDEDEDNLSRPRTKFRPRGQSGLEELTSLSGYTELKTLMQNMLTNLAKHFGILRTC